MTRIPLFPLNTVLFPGAPLKLHVFEPRYQRMIRRCQEEQLPFGVALIRYGQEAFGPLADPYDVGTRAEIVQVQRMEEGRLNLIVVGQERIRIRSLDDWSEPYLIGEVDDFPLEIGQSERLEDRANRLRRRVQRYLLQLMQTGIGQYDLDQLPSDPVALAWLAAALIQVEMAEKQAWLDTPQGEDLVSKLLRAYLRELALLVALLDPHGDRRDVFSQN